MRVSLISGADRKKGAPLGCLRLGASPQDSDLLGREHERQEIERNQLQCYCEGIDDAEDVDEDDGVLGPPDDPRNLEAEVQNLLLLLLLLLLSMQQQMLRPSAAGPPRLLGARGGTGDL